jgi:predicted GNAT family acetyltransferase
VRGALDDARRRGWRIVAQCPFVAHFVTGHPEYADLVAA